MKLRENYTLANCCKPQPSDVIIGYYSYDNFIKVHRSGCHNLSKAESSRLINLIWQDILPPIGFTPDEDYAQLDDLDFRILAHHQEMGLDYSLMVAYMLNIDDQTAFDRHDKLRNLGFLQRVKAVMMQYRKNIVKNKWIKHRNHTYYDLTDKGKKYLRYYLGKEC
jgi:hypothetical protein